MNNGDMPGSSRVRPHRDGVRVIAIRRPLA